MVTEVRKPEVSVTALREIQLVKVAREDEAKRVKEREDVLEAETKRIDQRKAVRAIEAESAGKAESPEPDRDYGKYNDYTVNSDHEMVVTVRERVTGKEIKQIPSDEALAVRQAYRRVTEHIIDETV